MRLMVPAEAVEDPLALYADPRQPRSPARPWVVANMIAGLDGSAAVRRVGALSSPRDAQLFERMRALADVVLVGAETVRREGYGMLELPADLEAARRRQGRAPLRVAVVSASTEFPAGLPLFRRPNRQRAPIIFTTSHSDLAKLDGLPVEVIVAGSSRVEPARALAELAARDLRVVLCEGGPQLLGAIIAAGLLDEYLLTLAPLVGGDRLPVIETSTITELHRFDLPRVAEEDGSLFLRFLHRGAR